MDQSVHLNPDTRTYERGVHFTLQRPGIPRFLRILPVPYLAIDLGTANTRVYVLGKGLIAEEPTNVQLKLYEDGLSGSMWGGGTGDGPHVFPMRSGVVNDIDAAATLLKPLIQRSQRFGIVRPQGIVCVPTDACQSERDALVEAVQFWSLRAHRCAGTIGSGSGKRISCGIAICPNARGHRQWHYRHRRHSLGADYLFQGDSNSLQ
jgi:hypothetical protein